MSQRGITITNYLAGGNPEGVIFAYMSNWTGQSIKIPRNLFLEFRSIDEINRPGVYFLIGQSDMNPDDKVVYVGEGNNLANRIATHLKDSDKSFAETIICFSSKDENLTVSHTKYLEEKIISHISELSEYRLINKKDGNKISLPRMVQDEMDTYFDNMKVLLPTLGYSVLHIVNRIKTPYNANKIVYFNLEVSNLKATSILTSNGIEVQKGSEMNPKETQSLSGSYSNRRKTLIEKGIVVQKGNKLVFNENFEFSSPSTAAALILGYSVNGREAWKTTDGKSINDLENAKNDTTLIYDA